MAPAVTSDTVPCTRAPRLCAASLPTSPLNAEVADICESVATMNSQMSNPQVSGNKPTDGQVFHPFACMPSSLVTGLTEATPNDSLPTSRLDPALLNPVPSDNGSSIVPDIVNGIGSRLSQTSAQLNLQNSRLVNLINSSQRTLNFVIKNNGTCSAGVLPNNSIGLMGGLPISENCNGGSVVASCSNALPLCPVSDLLSSNVAVTSLCSAVTATSSNMQSMPRESVTSVSAPIINASVNDCSIASNGIEPKPVLIKASTKINCENAVTTVKTLVGKPAVDKLSINSVTTRQWDLIARAELALRRLRRLQTRQANSSVRQQISGLVSTIRRPKSEPSSSGDPPELATDLKSMSTSELVGLVRRMQSSSSDASRLHGLAHEEVSQPDLSVCSGVGKTAGRLSSNLRHLESAIDSDATESSSGGESDEEPDSETTDADQYVVVSES